MSTTLFVIIGLIIVPLLLLAFTLYWYYENQKKVERRTHAVISDRGIIELIAKQPDGMLTVAQLAEQTGMSKSDARSRLYQLHYFGVLGIDYNANLRYHFSIIGEVDARPTPQLSEEPFLTVEDILLIFQHFNYRTKPVDWVMATGLPLSVIRRELKYFRKEKIINLLMRSNPQDGSTYGHTYVLQEPYRSNPQQFLDKQLDLNERVHQILRRKDLV